MFENGAPVLANGDIVRGLELVHYNGFARVWDVVGKFRATELAARQCAADLKWLRDRHPYDLYEMRVLLSVAQPKKNEEPLVVEADVQLDPAS